MMTFMRTTTLASLVLALAACSDSTGPAPYPDVAGTYTFTGSFNSTFCFDDEIRGTLHLVQPSRSQPELEGTANIETVLCDSVTPLDQMSRAVVDESGKIGFRLARPDGDSEWDFKGQVEGAGNSLSGSWTIVASTVGGTWTAYR